MVPPRGAAVTAVGVLSDRAAEYEALLRDAGVEVVSGRAEVLVADPTALGGADLAGVRWIQSTWAGVDSLDWSRLSSDVTVTTLPGVFGSQMAEYVLGHLLARSQRIVARYSTRSWDETVPSTLAGTALGVLGAGSIGTAIAGAARCFGMEVRGCRRTARPDPAYDQVYSIADLAEFASGLDHLVTVLPSTNDTAGLVDLRVFEHLAPGATFINVGRGSTVVTADVVSAVRSGQLGLAVLDVTEPEPLAADHEAWSVPNIVITGHTAAHSRPADIVEFFIENLGRFARGMPLRGVVDRVRGY
jgi:phosphoglycerate dehydrogenase-like enzyme